MFCDAAMSRLMSCPESPSASVENFSAFGACRRIEADGSDTTARQVKSVTTCVKNWSKEGKKPAGHRGFIRGVTRIESELDHENMTTILPQ